MAQKVEVILGTEDYKKLTGRQARAQNKASFSRVSGIFPNYEKQLNVIPLSGIANQIQVGSGAASVDGCVVEILDSTDLEATADGDYVVYLEVNLLADKAHVGIQKAEIELIQEDLTVNKIGTYQYQIASFTMIGGGIDETSISMDANYLIYNVQDSVWLREQSDNRYERALNINNNYVNEDLAGLNMAQIVNLFSEAMDVSMTSDLGANTVVGSSSQIDFANLHTALNDLLSEFYGVTTTLVLTFRYEAIYGKSTGGGQTLAVTINNGATFKFQYDNYGDNYETVNADAFQAEDVHFGKVNITNFVKAKGLELNGTAGGNFISGKSNITSVTTESSFINIDYASGNNLFKLGKSGGASGTRYTYLASYSGGGLEEGALRFYHDATNKVNHRVNGIGHQLAYLSDITRSSVQQLQYQRSSELITINSIEELEPEARTVRLTKELSARKALVNDIEQSIVNELKKVASSFIIDNGARTDIWSVEPMNKLKDEVSSEIWARYESEE